jgi:hypothetical protein
VTLGPVGDFAIREKTLKLAAEKIHNSRMIDAFAYGRLNHTLLTAA